MEDEQRTSIFTFKEHPDRAQVLCMEGGVTTEVHVIQSEAFPCSRECRSAWGVQV